MNIQFNIFLILSCFSLIATPQFVLQSFKQNIEDKLILIRDQIEANFDKFCTMDLTNNQCPVLSYDMCHSIADSLCIENFPTRTSCIGEGAYLSSLSSIRYPNHIHENSDLSQLDYKFTCATALLQDKFKQIAEDQEKRFSFLYIASRTGAFRCYPGFLDTGIQGCTDYDSRVRPWYIQSLSGYKNLIIAIDTSVHMNDQNRMGAGITAIKSIMSTAGPYDYVIIVSFNSETKFLYLTEFSAMNQTYREGAVYEISYLTAEQSGCNFENAFRKIGEIIKNPKYTKQAIPCDDPENIIFFMSSGNITEGASSASQLKQTIRQYSESNRITLFTYALGRNPNTEILQELSCEFGGMMFQIPSSEVSTSEIISKSQEYFNFIYSGYERKTPAWSEIYEDTFGYGQLMTVSLPVFFTKNKFRQYLGLVCFDIVIPEVQRIGATIEELSSLNNIKYTCQKFPYSSCQRQNFRKDGNLPLCENKQNDETCMFESQECQAFPSKLTIIQPGDERKYEQCCDLSVGGVVGIVLGFLCLIAIIGLIIYRINHKKQKKLKRRQKKIESLKKTIKEQRRSKKHEIKPNKIANEDRVGDSGIAKYYQDRGKGQQQSNEAILEELSENIILDD